jgi:predicted enzyme related to lactoylglutathione lyase
MSTKIVWLEISVANLERAVKFYENVFNFKMDLKNVFDKDMAFFEANQMGIKGSLIQVENYTGSNGIKPMFYVDILHESLEKVKAFGGEIITEPSLLKQKNKNGDTIIKENFIDNHIGYIAQIKDSENNYFYLYSHS